MSRRLLPLFITAAMFVVIAIPSWAKSNSSGSISVTITLAEKATVNNTTLAPGDYKVIADASKATIEKDGKVVAEVPCSLKTLSSKAPQTAATVDHGRLMEILASGKTEAIEFSSDQNSGN
jgi:hypothetical protein